MSLERMGMRARELALALELIDGRSAAAACRNAGYAGSTAAKKGHRIIRRPGVRKAIIEFGELVADQCKPRLRARLRAILQDSTASLPTLVAAVRLAVDETRSYGLLKEHLADRQQAKQPEIPPQVLAMLDQRVAELQKEREASAVSAR
jgi:hypothetical protein